MDMRNLHDKLDLKLGSCEVDTRAVHKEKGITVPTNAQLKMLLTRLNRSIMHSIPVQGHYVAKWPTIN